MSSLFFFVVILQNYRANRVKPDVVHAAGLHLKGLHCFILKSDLDFPSKGNVTIRYDAADSVSFFCFVILLKEIGNFIKTLLNGFYLTFSTSTVIVVLFSGHR